MLNRQMQPMSIRLLNEKAQKMNMQQADNTGIHITQDELAHSTTHFIVADKFGNIVCATQSLGMHYGSGIMIPDTGILMNTSLDNFSSSTDSPNAAKPGRRPRSTMSPTIVLKDGKPLLAIGSPGGQRIPVSVLQVLSDVIDYDMPLDKAIDLPRFHIRNSSVHQLVDLEYTMQPQLGNDLKALGWQAKHVEQNLMYFGPVNAITFTNQTLVGIGDDRRTNAVASVEHEN
jgi:gamma-glutamyltranspeptidase/glutathione hydrolase